MDDEALFDGSALNLFLSGKKSIMMKKFLAFLFALVFSAANAFAQSAGTEFSFDTFGRIGVQTEEAATAVSVFPSAERVPAGGEFSLLLKISMRPGWHVYWKNPGEAGLPLSIEWKNVPAGVELGEWRWSAPKYSELQGIVSYVFENVGYAEIPVRVADGVPAGAVNFTGTASWLACDDNGCYPQDAEISVRAEIVPAGESAVPANAEIFAEAEKAFPRVAAPEILEAKYSVGEEHVWLSVKARKDVAAAGEDESAFPRFFPYDEKFSPDAANVKPKIAEDDESMVLWFELPLKEADEADDEIDARGVLVFADGNAYEIVPARQFAFCGGIVEPEFSLGDFNAQNFFELSGVLAMAFFGGLILNLMPCVFPVLGLKIMHFVGKSGSDRRKIARHGFVFAFGVLISFWILAGALIALRLGGAQLGWGFQLQEPIFVYAMILLLLVFGLSMSGVFEFGASATAVGGSLQEKSGYAGSFFSGVLAVIVATPCAAPFLAPALGSALAVPPGVSLLIFTAIALGLAAPYVVLSCFPALLKFLPKPGAWMETFRQAMAFLLYAPALYFVWVLMGQIEDAFVQRDLLMSLAAVALACWIYGRWCVPWRSRAARIAGTLTALALFAGTVAYSVSEIAAAREFSLSENESVSSAPDAWGTWSPETQERALEEGKIVYVDFTARWCATCQVNKRVYSDAALREAFAEADVVKLRADWTNKNPAIAAELEKYGRAAVPVNVFLKKGREPVILGELFSGPKTVLAGLEEIALE